MIAPTSLSRLSILLCLYPILAIHAFASSSSTCRGRFHLPPLNLDGNKKHRHHHHRSRRANGGTALNVHLIPRGGAAAAAASAACENLLSNLSTWTTAPNSAFNLALGVLAAGTAGLKLYGAVGKKDCDGGVVSLMIYHKVLCWCFCEDNCSSQVIHAIQLFYICCIRYHES
jgi:hypothetical protein